MDSIPSVKAELQRNQNILQNEPVSCEIMFHTRKIELAL